MSDGELLSSWGLPVTNLFSNPRIRSLPYICSESVLDAFPSWRLALLTVHSLTYDIEGVRILDDITFSLPPGEKVGLVGANGSGKSTLLKLIAGHLTPTAGEVQLIGGGAIGYLPQVPNLAESLTVRDALASAMVEWSTARRTLDEALSRLSGDPDPQRDILEQYQSAMDAFEALGGWEVETRIEAVREGLGLGAIADNQPFTHLSGGQKTRVLLGSLLMSEPELLLLDEPTNYLDLPALEWLEAFVLRSSLSMLVVSHDRRFLDATVTRILEIDQRTRRLRAFPGNYSFYAEERVRERRQHAMAFQDQQIAIAKTEAAIRKLDQAASGIEDETVHFHYRKVAKGIARRATVQKNRLERSLTNEDHLDRPKAEKPIHLASIVDAATSDRRTLISAESVAVAPGDEVLLAQVDLVVRGGDRIALIGENGSGKTSLLRTLMGEIEPSAGSVYRSPSMRIGYLNQELLRSALSLETSVLDAVREVDCRSMVETRNLLAQFHFAGDAVFKRMRDLSAGERIRLELARASASGANVLLLDEPTSHLDLPAIEQLELALKGYPGAILAVSHDRAFLEHVGFDRIYETCAGRLLVASASAG